MKSMVILFWNLIVFASFIFGQSNNDTVSNNNSAEHEFCYTNPITRDTSLSMRDYDIIEVGDK